MIITGNELLEILVTLPGADEWNTVIVDDNYATIADWTAMKRFIDEVPVCPVPYTSGGVFDCDKISRWFLAILNVIWAQKHPSAPAAWGVINGKVPNDGINTTNGWHSIGFFIGDDKKIHLFGAQERSVMNDCMLENVKEVSSILVGG